MNRQNLTFSAFSGSTSTIGGIISSSNALAGEGGLTKSGFGTLILGANNTYTGGTAINGGTLQIGSFSSLGQTGVGFSFNGGTLRTTGNNLGTNRAVTLSANGGTFNVDSFRTLELNAAIGGVGFLGKTGGGTLILGSSNTYAGFTNVLSGTLRLGGSTFANRIGDGSELFVGASGIFDLNGRFERVGELSGSGQVDLGTNVTSALGLAWRQRIPILQNF